MANRVRRQRGDRLLVGVLASVGAAAGLFLFLVNCDGPEAAVMTVISQSSRPGTGSRLMVVFFGRVGYTRSAPDAAAFAAEVAFWQWLPPVVAVLVAAGRLPFGMG